MHCIDAGISGVCLIFNVVGARAEDEVLRRCCNQSTCLTWDLINDRSPGPLYTDFCYVGANVCDDEGTRCCSVYNREASERLLFLQPGLMSSGHSSRTCPHGVLALSRNAFASSLQDGVAAELRAPAVRSMQCGQCPWFNPV